MILDFKNNFKLKFEEKWLSLSLKEKRMVSLAVFFLVIFLLYELIWSPLDNKASQLRDTIQHDQTLLLWMQTTDQQIQNLSPLQQSSDQSIGSLLGSVQAELKQSAFASHIKNLRQGENESVQLVLQKVSFDELVTWLTTLWQNQGIVVSQAVITPDETLGAVEADLLMQRR